MRLVTKSPCHIRFSTLEASQTNYAVLSLRTPSSFETPVNWLLSALKVIMNLNGSWQLWGFPQSDSPIRTPHDLNRYPAVPATVPGNVELDYSRQGLLPDDLYFGDNIRSLHAYESYEWWYRQEFTVTASTASQNPELVFEGVDCLATYWLDNVKLGESDNMFIEQSFSLAGLLTPGKTHALVVRLRSAVIEAMSLDCGPRQTRSWGVFTPESLRIRKPGHCYGWDIMPRAVSVGLWRGVEIVEHPQDEFRDLYAYCLRATATRATLDIHYVLNTCPEHLENAEIYVCGHCGESHFETVRRLHRFAGLIGIEIDNPKLWWPLGYGDPHLYEVYVEFRQAGRLLASRTINVGLRTVALDRSLQPDQRFGFLFRINGEPILVKGANWVPADAFHSRDAERISHHLDLFVEAGCNLVRCWGGNVYEDSAFFDQCDRLGLMVWQDFAMACGLYPQDEAFAETIRREAVVVVRKLRNHPSLVIWCGDNECDENAFSEQLDPGTNRLTREVIPRVLVDEDPYRPYVPSSPYFTPEAVATQDVHQLSERHLWGPRDYYKSDYYRDNRAAFVSEIGFHGCPNVSSIKRFIAPEYLWPWKDNPQWAIHASDPLGLEGPYAYRSELMAKQIRSVFGTDPATLEDFALASQIVQAEAKKSFVETTRLAKWSRTGVIWWNVIDGWPQFSDAVVDYYYGKKLAFYYLRRVQQPLCLMIAEPVDGQVVVVAGNDSLEARSGTFRVWDADSGATHLEGSFDVPVNSNAELGRIMITPNRAQLLLLSWKTASVSGVNHALIGDVPLDFKQTRDWLAAIAALDGTFDSASVAR